MPLVVPATCALLIAVQQFAPGRSVSSYIPPTRAGTYRSRFRQHFHLVYRTQLDRFEVFTLRELSLELVSLFPEPGIVNVTLLESRDYVGELLLLERLHMSLGYGCGYDGRSGAYSEDGLKVPPLFTQYFQLRSHI